MTAPSPTQRRVLEFLQRFHQQHGYMPTVREIADGMAWKSANAADEHLKVLVRRGYVTRRPGSGRSIQITPAGQHLLEPTAGEPRPPMLQLPVVDMARVNGRTLP